MSSSSNRSNSFHRKDKTDRKTRSGMESYFILIVDTVAYILEDSSFLRAFQSRDKQFLKGSIFREEKTPPPNAAARRPSYKFLVRPVEDNTKLYECDRDVVAEIQKEEKDMLMALPDCGTRHQLYTSDRWKEAIQIEKGSLVSIFTKQQIRQSCGIVRFKGELPSNTGSFFGVELTENRDTGATDGIFRKKQYFKCEKNSALFVTIDKIRLCSAKSEIDLGMKVCVFLTEDDGQEHAQYGTVKYIGTPTGWKHIYVGIEMDKPIGEKDGYHLGEKLFDSKRDHALFVPLGAAIPIHRVDTKHTNSAQREDVEPKKPTSISGTNNDKFQSSVNPKSESQAILKSTAKELGQTSDKILKDQHEILGSCEKNRYNSNVNTDLTFKTDHWGDVQPDGRYPIPGEGPKTRSGIYSKNYPGAAARYSTDTTTSRGSSAAADPNSVGSSVDLPNLNKDGYHGGDSKGSHALTKPPLSTNKIDTNYVNRPEKNKPATNHKDNFSSGIRNKDQYHYKNTTENTGARQKSGANVSQRNVADSAFDDVGSSVDMIKHDGNFHSSQWKKPPEEKTVETPKVIDPSLQINSMVEVLASSSSNIPQYGVIRWIGIIPSMKSDDHVAGVELENELAACTDGTFAGFRYFRCEPRKALFVKLYTCKPDSRFSQKTHLRASYYRSETVREDIPPPEEFQPDFCGRDKGIQGHHNSCYLDATLFSMFAYQYSFDSLINRPKEVSDIEDYEKVQLVLKQKIVNPLRKKGYVSADKVMELREIMDRVGSLKGLTHEEKDPEEFLNTLFKQVFLAEAPVKIRHEGAENTDTIYMYQLFMEKDENNQIPTVQELLTKSFMFSSLKLEDIPPYFILQMPRFGKAYKMYNKVIPSLELDVTDIVENCARECVICGNLALVECRECFFEGHFKDKIASFCEECCKRFHSHHQRVNHDTKPFKVSDIILSYPLFRRENSESLFQRRKLELFAVVCIETSHYVAFVKAGVGEKAQWCFMDSMADRQGEIDGYNIPEVLHIEELTNWLHKDKIEKAGNNLPTHIRRLLSDAYMCFYQSQEVNIY